MLPKSEDEWRCALDVAPLWKTTNNVAAHGEIMTGTIRTLRTDKGFGFIKDVGGKEYFFIRVRCKAKGSTSPGGRLGRVRGRGRAKGARAENVGGRLLRTSAERGFSQRWTRREIASQRGDELIQIRADVSVESVVVLLRCGNAYQAIRLGPCPWVSRLLHPGPGEGRQLDAERQKNWGESDAQR